MKKMENEKIMSIGDVKSEWDFTHKLVAVRRVDLTAELAEERKKIAEAIAESEKIWKGLTRENALELWNQEDDVGRYFLKQIMERHNKKVFDFLEELEHGNYTGGTN